MIKLIATDMDGTLLNSSNEIQEGFYEVFNELQEKEIIFAAASGRQYYNLLERFKGIEEKMMFIAENGTFVVDEVKGLISNYLSYVNDYLKSIEEFFIEPNFIAFLKDRPDLVNSTLIYDNIKLKISKQFFYSKKMINVYWKEVFMKKL